MLGFPAADCIVFEDVPAGVKAGKAAGSRVIAFTTTVNEDTLRQAGADWVVGSCADIRVNANGNLTLHLLLP